MLILGFAHRRFLLWMPEPSQNLCEPLVADLNWSAKLARRSTKAELLGLKGETLKSVGGRRRWGRAMLSKRSLALAFATPELLELLPND